MKHKTNDLLLREYAVPDSTVSFFSVETAFVASGQGSSESWDIDDDEFNL